MNQFRRFLKTQFDSFKAAVKRGADSFHTEIRRGPIEWDVKEFQEKERRRERQRFENPRWNCVRTPLGRRLLVASVPLLTALNGLAVWALVERDETYDSLLFSVAIASPWLMRSVLDEATFGLFTRRLLDEFQTEMKVRARHVAYNVLVGLGIVCVLSAGVIGDDRVIAVMAVFASSAILGPVTLACWWMSKAVDEEPLEQR